MATQNKTEQHNPDTQRDFQTGTVNPGPGMAPPHRADDIPAGSMRQDDKSQGNQAKQPNRQPATKDQDKSSDGCCGCG